MTGPSYKNEVSAGTILQLAGMVLAGGIAFGVIQVQVTTQGKAIEAKERRIAQLDERMRLVEVQASGAATELAALRRDLSGFRQDLRDTAELLRRVERSFGVPTP